MVSPDTWEQPVELRGRPQCNKALIQVAWDISSLHPPSVPWKRTQRQRECINNAPGTQPQLQQLPTFISHVHLPLLFYFLNHFKANFIYYVISPPSISISCQTINTHLHYWKISNVIFNTDVVQDV